MVGNVPDYDATLSAYASLAEHQSRPEKRRFTATCICWARWVHAAVFAPLAAEILASQMSHEPLPMDKETLAALNPNRLWVRKLLKGKAVK